jgi:hypothetical protein
MNLDYRFKRPFCNADRFLMLLTKRPNMISYNTEALVQETLSSVIEAIEQS